MSLGSAIVMDHESSCFGTALTQNARDHACVHDIEGLTSPPQSPDHTSRLCTTAASMNEANSGCGSNGRDFNSGWNCTPMNQGWSSYSTISGSTPSGDRPENFRPCCSSRSL